jgi:hypothetical protein
MPQWRPISWAIAGWLGLFVLLGIMGGPLGALQVFLPFGVLVFLGLFAVQQLTRRKERECPSCGLPVERGKTTCRHCGFDFAAAAANLRPGSHS